MGGFSLDMLPFLDGWELKIVNFLRRSLSIKPGEEIDIMDQAGPGWWYSASGTADSLLVRVKVILDEQLPMLFDAQFGEVWNLGLRSPSNDVPWMVTPGGPIYTLTLAPAVPIPFKKRLKLSARNEDTSDVALLAFGGLTRVITDMAAFKKSLKALTD